jgi:hypothetical protein
MCAIAAKVSAGVPCSRAMVSFAKFDQTGYRTPISAARRQKIAARNHVIVCTSGNNLVKAGGERNRNAVAQKLRTSVTSR